MTTQFNNAFEADATPAASNHRGLLGTAQLTSTSSEIANKILQVIDADYDNYKELVAESKIDSNAMDKLIASTFDLSEVDIEFLKELNEDVIDGMLKSQQSKRSRAKSKTMTLDNYRTMLTGAIAENLLRLAANKPKSAGGFRRAPGDVEFTDEQLAEMAEDQERVRRELRNIQSKKSIMKRKEGFTEEDEHWQKLLTAEEQLKSIRISSGPSRTVFVDETKDSLRELIGDVDPTALKASESKEMLAKVKALLG